MIQLPGWFGSTLSLAESADTAPWWSHGYLAMGLLTAVVLIAGIQDWKTQRIPNWLVGPAILAGFALAGLTGFLGAGWDHSGWPGCVEGLQSAALSFSLAFVPFFIIWKMGGLGGGDVKLIGAAGAIAANWEMVLGAAFYGFFIAMIWAFVIMVRYKIVKRTLRRIFNAALMSAAKVKPDLNKDTIRIPFGIPFGIGAVLTGIELLLRIKLPWSIL